MVQETHSDAPILPVSAIERLHVIRPDRVDWVFDQTQIEAEHRRKEDSRTNLLIFIERALALIFALIMGLCGVVGGIYAALQGHEWLGGIVASVTVGTLAAAFLRIHQK